MSLQSIFPQRVLPYGADEDNTTQIVAWASARGYRYSQSGRCLHWLVSGGCHVAVCHETRSEHPWMDHVTGWTKDGAAALLLCQPYQMSPEDLRDLMQTADRFGIEAWVHGDGWYGNGTVAIELTVRPAVS
jgi:hypothetical protein